MIKAFLRGLGYVPVTDVINTVKERDARYATLRDEYNTLFNQSFALSAAYTKLRTEYEAWLKAYHAPTAMEHIATHPADAPACKILAFKPRDVA